MRYRRLGSMSPFQDNIEGDNNLNLETTQGVIFVAE
jgi:hypothetical protein